MTIWVCGEALMDLFPDGEVVGGGPANTAKALARLGNQVEFIGGISTDEFGQRVRQELIDDEVGLRHAYTSNKPTCTATVSVDETGAARYEFSIANTATFDFGDWLPDPYTYLPSLLHIGSLATVIQPGAGILFEWAQQLSELAPIIFDPNIRPAVLSDHGRYLHEVEKWVAISTIIKVSDDDVCWLYPHLDPFEAAQRWLGSGVVMVFLTQGAQGISAITADGVMSVPGVLVDVIDTVGAGDTVGAVIAQAVVREGVLNLAAESLKGVLESAVVAAAITCGRAGANPPTKKELTTALEKRVP